MDNNQLSELINQILKEKGLDINRLASLTNIPKRYLTALKDGDFKNLPPAPYVRGYILRICRALNIKPDDLIEAYRELSLKKSGRNDSMPTNRFDDNQNHSHSILIWLIAALLIAGIFFLRFTPDFRGVPEISVNLPDFLIRVNDPLFIIEGRVTPGDAIFINTEPTLTDNDGNFTKEVMLEVGSNAFEIKAVRFLGRETKIIRQIFYEERQQEVQER